MEIIEAYKTIDGKIFTIESEAINHENILIAVKEIMDSFGGTDQEINAIYNNFMNGKGFIRIDRKIYDNTLLKVNKLKEFLGYKTYDITNVRCFEDEYLGKISVLFYCLLEDVLTGDFLRYGAPYYVKNQEQAEIYELKRI